MNRNKDTFKSKSSDNCHRSYCNSSTEAQLKALPPSRAVVEFYQNKLAHFEKEFTRLSEKVLRCKRECDGDGELKTELRRCSDEVFTLQKAMSDMQTYFHQERNRAIRLNSENDMLKIQMARDRKTINFLLTLCDATEDQVHNVILEGKTECLRKSQGSITKDKLKFPMKIKVGKKHPEMLDPEMLLQRVNSLESQIKELTESSQDEIYSLHHDRDILQMEKERQYERLQDQISALNDRLTKAYMNNCELTNELIALKKDFFKKEEKWVLGKERERQNKHLCGGVVEVPEEREHRSKFQKDSMLKLFKEHVEKKEKLIKLYKEQCVSLENELCELNSSRDRSAEVLQVQVEKMNQQLTSMKDKYQKLYRRRCLEAEGFRSDVKILKGRIHSLERKLACHNYTVDGPLRKELIVTARETKFAAKCLEKELILINNKLMGFKMHH